LTLRGAEGAGELHERRSKDERHLRSAQGKYTLRPTEHKISALLIREITRVLDHLSSVEFEPEVLDAPTESFTPLKKADATQTLNGQIETNDWLKDIGAVDDEEVIAQAEKDAAKDAFTALTTGASNAKDVVLKMNTPPAIKQIVGMLTGYEWAFVEEAQRLRSMAVAKIVEETEHPDARIRLKALELLGKVTEVGLFTERISVKKEELSDDELNQKIKDKLAELQKTVDAEAKEKEEDEDVTDVEVKEESDEDDAA
jgi:hypothetical protein